MLISLIIGKILDNYTRPLFEVYLCVVLLILFYDFLFKNDF